MGKEGGGGGGGGRVRPGHMETWWDLTMGTYRTSHLGLVTSIADALKLPNVISTVIVTDGGNIVSM